MGSHICDRLIAEGIDVICMDNLLTGNEDNIKHLIGNPMFKLIRYDVTNYIYVEGKLDFILHFASPASPKDYLNYPIQTLKVGSLGTLNSIGLAKAKKAVFVLASTSEVYGDPKVNPQPEDYWGNVNSVGLRGVYDEAKRFAEAMTMAYHRYHGVDTRIVRIFNTYGSRMRLDDGRALPTFITQALLGDKLTVYGDGSQTRSFTYIDDTVDGIYKLMRSECNEPINIGNPEEISISDFAEEIGKATGKDIEIEKLSLPEDDPKVRRPDISRAIELLGWEPKVSLSEGLSKTVPYFREKISEDG